MITCMQFNIAVKAKHIPGELNIVADKLSRFELQGVRDCAPWQDAEMTAIPSHLLLSEWM